MAFEKMGLGAQLTFDQANAVNAMVEASNKLQELTSKASGAKGPWAAFGEAVDRVGKNVEKFAGGAKKVVGAIGGLAVGATPVAIAMGGAIGTAMKFEKQVSAVQAAIFDSGKTAEESAKELGGLKSMFMDLGIKTNYSSLEIAEGAEVMAKAGIKPKVLMESMEAVAQGAAVEMLNMGDAGTILAKSMAALGIDMDKVTKSDVVGMVDMMTVASNASTASWQGLGYAMSYAGATVSQMGVSTRDAYRDLAIITDATNDGTIAGTAYKNMLLELAMASEKSRGRGALEKLGLGANFVKENVDDMGKVLGVIGKKLAGVENAAERVAIAEHLVGKEAMPGMNALLKAIETGKYEEMSAQMDKAQGAAKRMSEIRMDNALGQWKLLTSSVETFSIVALEGIVKTFKPAISGVTESINNVLFALKDLFEETETNEGAAAKYGKTSAAVAVGIKAGIDDIQKAWNGLGDAVKSAMGGLGIGKDAKEMARMITVVVAATGAFAAVGGALAGVGFIVSNVVALGSGLATMFSAAWGIIAAVGSAIASLATPVTSVVSVLSGLGAPLLPIVGIVLAIIAVVYLLRDQICGVLTGLWSGIQAGWEVMGETVGEVFGTTWEMIKATFSNIGEAWSALASLFGEGTSEISEFWGGLGRFLVAMVFTPIQLVLGVIAAAFQMVASIAWGVTEVIKTVAGFVSGVVDKMKLAYVLATGTSEEKASAVAAYAAKAASEGPAGEEAAVRAEIDRKREVLRKRRADEVAESAAKQKAAAAAPPKMEAKVENKIENNLNVRTCVDGKDVAKATAKHEAELRDRAGFKATQYQRRITLEHGAAPISNT